MRMLLLILNVADQKVVGAVRKTDVQHSNGDDKDLSLKCLQVIDRQDLDFTEQLWTILRGAQSVLAFILEALE